ncbi:MAG: hypothetical protein ABWY22_10745 [Flavobacterium sp.]
MKQKYFILVFMFFCMLCGQGSYALTSGESNIDEYGDYNHDGIPDIEQLDEVVITDPGNPGSCMTCDCDPFFCASPPCTDCSCNASFCQTEYDPCLFNPALCGSGGSSGNPPADPAVTNNIHDPCLKNAVDRIINGSDSNPFSKFINGPFFREEHQSLTFSQYSDSSVAGVKINAYQDETFNQIIALNFAALSYASKEYITAVIYHEIIHGILSSQGIATASSQHEIMASDEWRQTISDQLRIDFPDLDQEDADALAWEGLGSTSKWRAIYDNDIANNTGVTGDINAVQTNYRNFNNSTNGYYGTSCNN